MGNFLKLSRGSRVPLAAIIALCTFGTVGCGGGGGGGGGAPATPPTNTAPVANADVAVTLIDTAVTIDVLGNDTDADGDALSLLAISTPTGGTAVDNGSGQILYTPNTGFTGTDLFTYTVQDSAGNTATGGVSVTVSATPNGAPVAADDAATTDEDNAVVIAVLANDTDPDGDPLTVTLVSSGSNGATAISGGGTTITYTPGANFNGSDSFDYTITDSLGTPALATVTVTVNPINDAPVAVDDTATTASPTAVIINVLANDTDIDGDVLSAALNTGPGNGAVVVNPDNTMTYTPNGGFVGTDTFTYDASDGTVTDTATVMVTVTPAPVLDFDVFAVANGTPTYDLTTGVGAVTVAVLVQESTANPNFPNGIAGADLSLDHDPSLFTVAAVNEGAALLALGGAEFFGSTVSADNVVLDIIVSSTGAPLLVATTSQELASIDYVTVPGVFVGNPEGVAAEFRWSAGLVNNIEANGSTSAPALTNADAFLSATGTLPGFQFLAPGGVANYDLATGTGAFTQSFFVLEGVTGAPTEFDGISFGIAHDTSLLTPVSIEQSPFLQAFNGGAGPAFFEVSIQPGGVTAGGLFDFSGTVFMTADVPAEVIRVNYELVAGVLAGDPTGTTTGFTFVDTLGTPAIFNIVSVLGTVAFPTFVQGTVQLLP